MEHLIPQIWFDNLSQSVLLLIVAVTVGVLIKGADWLVDGASGLAIRLGMPKVIVGATIVAMGTTSPECAVSDMAAWSGNPGLALGTSLPELVVGIASITKGHKELLVGNIIGADVLNVLFVVGASAAAALLPIVENGERIFLYLHLPAMLVVLMLFRVSALAAIKRGVFARWHGLVLLLCYVLYVVGQFIDTRA